jgi:hypothetical protein
MEQLQRRRSSHLHRSLLATLLQGSPPPPTPPLRLPPPPLPPPLPNNTAEQVNVSVDIIVAPKNSLSQRIIPDGVAGALLGSCIGALAGGGKGAGIGGLVGWWVRQLAARTDCI